MNAATPELLCYAADQLEQYGPPYVCCFAQLSFPIFSGPGKYPVKADTEKVMMDLEFQPAQLTGKRPRTRSVCARECIRYGKHVRFFGNSGAWIYSTLGAAYRLLQKLHCVSPRRWSPKPNHQSRPPG